MSLAVSVKRLVSTVSLAVSGDLPVDALEALADPGCDRLDRLSHRQAVGDLDPVVLVQVAVADRSFDETHAASVDEP